VIRNTAENFAELSLELGGKSPFIVFDDANIDSAVNGSVAGIFAASGQSCVAGSRLYLHDAIADRFLAKMTAIANSIRIGDPQAEDTQMGPLCTSAQIDHIETQVARAVEQGGRILAGGSRVDGMDGLFFQPTIIECPDPSMEIVDTELFGPVLAVLRFSDEDDVIAQANHSVHGLAAGLFTRDSARSMRVARRLRAGIVWVNTYRVISPIAEFGGSKQSGYGRESGMQAVYDYTRPKTVWMNLSDDPVANPFEPR
jgi:aldehyde dehydrogenase (NAD+)